MLVTKCHVSAAILFAILACSGLIAGVAQTTDPEGKRPDRKIVSAATVPMTSLQKQIAGQKKEPPKQQCPARLLLWAR
jgi:hypothetical protein